MKRKKRQSRVTYKCAKCSYKANGPWKLGVHYKQHPSHASDKSVALRKERPRLTTRSYNKTTRLEWLEEFLIRHGSAHPSAIFSAARKEGVAGEHSLRSSADESSVILREGSGRHALWTYSGRHKQLPTEAIAGLPLEAANPRPRRRSRGLKFCPDCGHDLREY